MAVGVSDARACSGVLVRFLAATVITALLSRNQAWFARVSLVSWQFHACQGGRRPYLGNYPKHSPDLVCFRINYTVFNSFRFLIIQYILIMESIFCIVDQALGRASILF